MPILDISHNLVRPESLIRPERIVQQFTKSTEKWLEDCLEDSMRDRANSRENSEGSSPSDESDETPIFTRTASKPHSTPLTLKWLEENYEIAEGVCIPRSALYMHYLDFCEKNDSNPVNAASFGKIIRQQFPQITTRRLGTRGQSKYHYYGIGVRESSHYYDVMYSRKGVQNTGDGKKDNCKQIVAYSPRSKLGTLLPEFPNVSDLKLPANLPEDKFTTQISTFVMMYRTHCQRILDTVIRANFDEVQSFLLHFWQGMPQHMVPILGTPIVVSLVGVCDSILYKAISGVLMPTVLQALPDSLTQVIRKFAKQLDEWLKVALDELPENLRKTKFDLARRFAQVLRRQTSLNHLCQASRTVIHSGEITSQMLDDWSNVDLSSIARQTLYTMDNYSERDLHTIVSLYKEFEGLLNEQAPIESYTEWLDTMVERCVVQPSQKKPGTLKRIARQFLLMWSCFGTRVIRDMTLHSAPSFGSFHLLHLMFDDYVLYLVESLHSQERANEMLRTIKGEDALIDPEDELILPNPSTVGQTSFSCSSPDGSSISSPASTPLSDRQTVITDAREAYNTNQGSYRNSSQSAVSPSCMVQSQVSYGAVDHRIQQHMNTSPNPLVTGASNSTITAAAEEQTSDPRYQYGSYGTQPMTSHMMSRMNEIPQMQYGYNVANNQYGYGSRESCNGNSASRHGQMASSPTDWSENNSSRYSSPSSSDHLQSCGSPQYSNYPRGMEYEGYGYDVTHSHNATGVIVGGDYQRYGGDNGYYGNATAMELLKRKVEDEDQRKNKRQARHDYDFHLAAGYVRA